MSVICEAFIPRDRRIYFYVLLCAASFNATEEKHVKEQGRETKKRVTNQPRCSTDYSTYPGLSLHFATFHSYATKFCAATKSRLGRSGEKRGKLENISALKLHRYKDIKKETQVHSNF